MKINNNTIDKSFAIAQTKSLNLELECVNEKQAKTIKMQKEIISDRQKQLDIANLIILKLGSALNFYALKDNWKEDLYREHEGYSEYVVICNDDESDYDEFNNCYGGEKARRVLKDEVLTKYLGE